MFHTNAMCVPFNKLSDGKDKRTTPVKLGCYIVMHLATGKCVTGISGSVSQDVDRICNELKSFSHESRHFNRIMMMDSDLRVFEYATETRKDAKAILKQIRGTMYPQYLLLN